MIRGMRFGDKQWNGSRCLTALLAAGWIAGCVGEVRVRAADWPWFRGPTHDGATSESLLKQWPATGPVEKWRRAVGDGLGGAAIVGDRLWVMAQRRVEGEDRECVVALRLSDGQELWSVPVGPGVQDTDGGPGPRSTPTVLGGRVFTLGARLHLNCLDAESGSVIWAKDLVRDYGGQVISWFGAASPVVESGLVLVHGGGTNQAYLAFSPETGEVRWRTGSDLPTHASPVPMTLNEVRQVVFMTQQGLVSREAASGREIWRQAVPYATATAMSPVAPGADLLYVCSAYAYLTTAFRTARDASGAWSLKELWRMRRTRDSIHQWTSPVTKDGHVYGLFGFKAYGEGPLRCVDAATGRVCWSQPGFGSGGSVLRSGGRLLVVGDSGTLALVEATPESYREVARAQLKMERCWSPPALSAGKLVLRDMAGLVCLVVGEE